VAQDQFNKKERKMDILIKVITILIVIVLGYGGWLLKREINYSMDYQDKVIETIQEQNAPLLERIKTLENEVKTLKEGKK
jgi:cell division protein FtsB